MVAFSLLLTLAAATTMTATTVPKLELVVLKDNWSSLGWRYDEPPRPASGSERLFSAQTADIQSYAWSSQTISLTRSASERLQTALEKAALSVPRLSALKESLGHGNPLDRVLYQHAFFVALDGEPLYWGIFLDPPSQMAIEFPVLRAAWRDGQAVFHVLPVHLPFFESDPGGPDTGAAESREAREVPKGMLDAFREHAQAPRVAALRARIRDERVRRILEQAGALRP